MEKHEVEICYDSLNIPQYLLYLVILRLTPQHPPNLNTI